MILVRTKAKYSIFLFSLYVSNLFSILGDLSIHQVKTAGTEAEVFQTHFS